MVATQNQALNFHLGSMNYKTKSGEARRGELAAARPSRSPGGARGWWCAKTNKATRPKTETTETPTRTAGEREKDKMSATSATRLSASPETKGNLA